MDTAQLTPPTSGQHPRPPRERNKPEPAHATPGHGNAPPQEHDVIDLNVRQPGKASIVVALVVIVLALAAMLAVGIVPRIGIHHEIAADAAAAANAPVAVTVANPVRADTVMNVALPGTLRPWQEVSIFARTTGYLKAFYTDISEQVKKGQLMADIETPEVDQQLRGAQATLLQLKASVAKSKSDLALAEVTDRRFESLKGTNGVTQLELDQYAASLQSARANVQSAEANVTSEEAEVHRLSDLQSFEKVLAPFNGVVTGRTYDVGSMIIANPTSNDIKPMFKIAENDVLRVFVNVPQSYSLTIKKGMDVKVTARERPGSVYTGKVMGTTNYLDPTNRSLLTEIKVPNPDFSLLPGMFVEANFTVKRDKPPLLIPAPALVSDSAGNRVAIVQDGKVHFQKVDLGVDYGKELEVVGGLNGDEQVIANPGEKTIEGVEVTVANERKDDAAPVIAEQQRSGQRAVESRTDPK